LPELSFNATKIDVVVGSGRLRVTVHPRSVWYVRLLELSFFAVYVTLLYRNWTQTSLVERVCLTLGGIGLVGGLIYQWSGSQFVEFDEHWLTTCREIHGWERKHEYKIEECTELEWSASTEDQPCGLRCKVGTKTVRICDDVSEAQAVDVLVALQKHLPEVAQKVCSYPNYKEHFIRLGLGR
jgi:hypothetical protein